MPLIGVFPVDVLRVCYLGVLTIEQAQARIGSKYNVVELRSARAFDDHDEFVDATEVLFVPVSNTATKAHA